MPGAGQTFKSVIDTTSMALLKVSRQLKAAYELAQQQNIGRLSEAITMHYIRVPRSHSDGREGKNPPEISRNFQSNSHYFALSKVRAVGPAAGIKHGFLPAIKAMSRNVINR